MQRIVLLLLLALVTLTAKSQTKVYLSSDGKVTTDLKKASSYAVIVKLEGDSSYYVQQYNMKDTIMLKGFFKDAAMSIANGKFYYYKFVTPFLKKSLNYVKHKYDTVWVAPKSYLESSGVYLNNRKVGVWIRNNIDIFDRLIEIHTTDYLPYENGNLNGMYKSIYQSGEVHETGRYINGYKTGEWVQFGRSGDTLVVDYFKKGIFLKEVSRIPQKEYKAIEADYNFEDYLNKELADKIMETENYSAGVIYQFILNTDGKFIEPEIIHSSYFNLDRILIESIMNAPKWKSLILDKPSQKVHINIRLSVDIDNYRVAHVKYKGHTESVY